MCNRFEEKSDNDILTILKNSCKEGELYRHRDGRQKIYLPNAGVSIPVFKDDGNFFAMSVYSTIFPYSLGRDTKPVEIEWYHFKDKRITASSQKPEILCA